MTRVLSSLLLAAALALAAPFARAAMPESGWWWNPAEPGYGFAIEVQDDYVFMVVFNYTEGGQATWHAAQGRLQTNGEVFLSDLYSARDGTCLGCTYRPSTAFLTGGQLRLAFLSESTANVTVGNRTIPIQRHDFRLSYGSDASQRTGIWRGEWQIVLDFSAIPDARAFPYFGDIIKIDLTGSDSSGAYFDGCRPENSIVARCSQAALDAHGVSGYYSATDGTYFIFVEDEGTSQQWPAGSFLLYEVEAGLNQFRGYAKRCHRNANDFLRDCLENNNFAVLPARGWRSASRSFVDGNANAPSSQPGASVDAKAGGASPWRDLPATIEGGEMQPKRERPDPEQTRAVLRAAAQKIAAGAK